VSDIFSVLLLSHDKYIFQVAVNFEIEDVLSVKIEAVDKVDLGGDFLIQGYDVPYLQPLEPHIGEIDFTENLYIEKVTFLNIQNQLEDGVLEESLNHPVVNVAEN